MRGLTKLESTLIILLIIVAIVGGYGWLLAQQKPTSIETPEQTTPPTTEETTPPTEEITPQPKQVIQNITFVDSAGRYITVKWPLKRVVALSTDAAEVILTLGAEDVVVGVTEYITRKPELSKLTDRTLVGTCFKPNIEAIISTNPEVVITYVRWPSQEALEEKLEPLGIKVIRLDFYKISTLFNEVRLLGLLLNKTEEADRFVEFWKGILDEIQARVKKIPAEERVKVYIEGYKDYKAAGPGSGWDDDLRIAGGINIFADSPVAYPKVSPEAVIERNPDVIIKAVSTSVFQPYKATDPSPLKEIIQAIVSRPGWDQISAVQNGRVYVISGVLSSGPRAVVGICYIAKWLYPQVFADINPEDIHKQYLETFLGVEYSGIWAYPT